MPILLCSWQKYQTVLYVLWSSITLSAFWCFLHVMSIKIVGFLGGLGPSSSLVSLWVSLDMPLLPPSYPFLLLVVANVYNGGLCSLWIEWQKVIITTVFMIPQTFQERIIIIMRPSIISIVFTNQWSSVPLICHDWLCYIQHAYSTWKPFFTHLWSISACTVSIKK